MIVRCTECMMYFDDEFRRTYCPHHTFPANDGHNHFAHHPGSYLSWKAPNPVDIDTQRRRR